MTENKNDLEEWSDSTLMNSIIDVDQQGHRATLTDSEPDLLGGFLSLKWDQLLYLILQSPVIKMSSFIYLDHAY